MAEAVIIALIAFVVSFAVGFVSTNITCWLIAKDIEKELKKGK